MPVWRQLVELLRKRIEDGDWEGRLPSGADLAAEYEVAPVTLWKAIGVLRDHGWVQTFRGSAIAVTRPEERKAIPDP